MGVWEGRGEGGGGGGESPAVEGCVKPFEDIKDIISSAVSHHEFLCGNRHFRSFLDNLSRTEACGNFGRH